MPLISNVINWFIKKRIHQIELFMKYPHDVQHELLQKLIYTAKNTEWGEKYSFHDTKTYARFKENVPINDYESLKPSIDRIRMGEQNILWPSEITWFAKSSGTTSDKSKYIPVSKEAMEECHFKGGKDLASIYLNNHPESKIFDGKAIGMGGSHQITEIQNQEYYDGDLSAILIQNAPFWAEFKRTPSLSIALMPNWEEKIEKMAHSTIKHKVTNVLGVPSWTLLLFKRVLEITGKNNILEVWPEMEAFFHGGINFSPYRKQFEELLPKTDMRYVENYNASEGFFGIQDQTDVQEMLLMLDYGIFYEFIPKNEIEKENPRIFPLDEVELNKNYAILITTNSGLWRYQIGDTIKFTSLNPYRVVVTGRTKNFINAFGEEIIIDNAEKAIDIACKKTSAIVNEYTACPVYMTKDSKNGAHEWLIEFEKEPKNIEEFTVFLDNALKSINSDYEAKRFNDLILQRPIVKKIPQGTFYKWMKRKGKLGGQNKVPRLYNSRKHVDAILEII
jgi:GH3 auxin-responsive promoter